MSDTPTRHREALHYWKTMRASTVDMPYDDRKEELRMLADHCQSDVLRGICEKNLNMAKRRPVRQRLSEIRA